MLTYSEAVLRAYNRLGRRDNIFKARIKILVEALGAEAFAREVEEDWAQLRNGPNTLTETRWRASAAHFIDPRLEAWPEASPRRLEVDPRFRAWRARNVTRAPPARLCGGHHQPEARRRRAGRRDRR